MKQLRVRLARLTKPQRTLAVSIGGIVILVIAWAAYLRFAKGYTWAYGLLGKPWWDWLQLLVVPVALAIAVVLLNQQDKKQDRELAKYQAQENALQSYLDKMTELLLKENLREAAAEGGEDVVSIARARTLATLRTLDNNRKGLLVRFLYESKLIDKRDPVIDLSGANLSEADLTGADLSNADLSRANLYKACLIWANLTGTNLTGAYLRDANLSASFLWGGDLSEADLTGAWLIKATLSNAHLERATVTNEQLAKAESLEGATMPDGTKHV